MDNNRVPRGAYPIPEAINTTKRCKFGLPGRKYNCRALGKYVLDGKGYCAPHYGVTWKFKNPEYGQQHEWHFHINRFTGEVDKYESCRRCFVVRVHEGLPQEPCGGKMPRITLQ